MNVHACLISIGVTIEHVQGRESITEEFKAIKRVYFARVLVAHPDKGGDAAVFRGIQEAWETLRDAYEKARIPAGGFSHYFSAGGKDAAAPRPTSFSDEVPDYSWFEAAAEVDVPPYRCVGCARASSHTPPRLHSRPRPPATAPPPHTHPPPRAAGWSWRAATAPSA